MDIHGYYPVQWIINWYFPLHPSVSSNMAGNWKSPKKKEVYSWENYKTHWVVFHCHVWLPEDNMVKVILEHVETTDFFQNWKRDVVLLICFQGNITRFRQTNLLPLELMVKSDPIKTPFRLHKPQKQTHFVYDSLTNKLYHIVGYMYIYICIIISLYPHHIPTKICYY